MKYRIGQKVRYVGPKLPTPLREAYTAAWLGTSALEGGATLGEVMTVIDYQATAWGQWSELMAKCGCPNGTICYVVEQASGRKSLSHEPWLEPYDDGREKGEWTDELHAIIAGGNVELHRRGLKGVRR